MYVKSNIQTQFVYHLIMARHLTRQHPLDATPQCPLHQSDGANQLSQLRWLQGGRVVSSFPCLVQGHMTLDDLCSKSYSCYCNTYPRLMARIPNRDIRKLLLVLLL